MKKSALKRLLLMGLAIGIWTFLALKTSFGTEEILALYRKGLELYRDFPALTLSLFFVVYLFSTALSLPLASVLTLLAGATFGFWWGLAVVSLAASLGATLAFKISRHFLRDWVQTRFEKQLKTINGGIKKEGAYYLFILRLSPIFPFFLINLLLGLTPISTNTFYWVSQIGMLPGSALYLNAGAQLSNITNIKNILSPQILISLTLIGIFPVIVKRLLKK